MHAATRVVLGVLLTAMASAVGLCEPVSIPIPNGDFEQGLQGWTLAEGEKISSLSQDQAASGKYSLHIRDVDPKSGSDIKATRVHVAKAGEYQIRGNHFPVSGDGLGIYVRVIDRAGRTISSDDSHVVGLSGSSRKWTPFAYEFIVPADDVDLELWIHSYAAAQVEAYLDDFSFVFLGAVRTEPLWEPHYKIKSGETGRLTAADVVGPDGIVYPNWTKCGVQGGIPTVKAVCTVEQFGAKADDEGDDSAAIAAACESAGKTGGGAVVLGAGTYYLDRQILVPYSGVVLRGQGADKTRVIFRYALPESGVTFFSPAPGAKVGRNTRVEMHAKPTGLMKMRILVDGTLIAAWERSLHSGNTFNFGFSGSSVISKAKDGPHKLTAEAEYKDGSLRQTEISVVVDSTYDDKTVLPLPTAAICFTGQGTVGPKLMLAKDGKRGDMSLTLQSVEGLKVGDAVFIDGPATDRWKTLTKNKCLWGNYRNYIAYVEGIEGNVIRLNQPLRIEFPVIDGSYAQRFLATERCGAEDFYFEQTQDLWITSIQFRNAVNCWGRGVRIYKHGRFPIYGSRAKWCEVRDCVFDDAWFKGGGGTAYAGWENSWDCLMENVETYKLRHGPLFQWAASGCVIRNSRFHESDGQWHSGWTNENLMENCLIESTTQANGGYGYGLWASPPEDAAHGPNGPRNVVYNCDVVSLRAGLWMGGMNENWLILYNRFVVGSGPGVFAKTFSFDHILKGNVFTLKDGKSPMVQLATADCTGVEVTANQLFGGNGQFVGGAAKPVRLEGNTAAAVPATPAERPKPPVASIYEWELAHVGK
jgi:hypothetical protein